MCDLLVDNALHQPQVFVHRDYHSRNLMHCAENNPGILDFQDAVEGPLTYDLVSLLKDCYLRLARGAGERVSAGVLSSTSTYRYAAGSTSGCFAVTSS